MYKIDRQNNSLKSLMEVSFSSLGFRERDHLQEWLANNPQALTKKDDKEDELLGHDANLVLLYTSPFG